MPIPSCHCGTGSTLQAPSKTSHYSHLLAQIQRFWQSCWQLLSISGEPKVWQTYDRQGRTAGWRVFDPETGRTMTFSSELEVRLWLEKRLH